MRKVPLSFGRYPRLHPRAIIRPHTRHALQRMLTSASRPVLPYGLGRSYGDSCLTTGTLIDMTSLDHFINFNEETGRVRCESGVSLRDLLSVFVPRDWFLAVTPGTQDVTIGGAIANDVHGKNHPRAGTFGAHVHAFGLLRSNGEELVCTPTEHADLFRATIGGLGLTGIITWAEIELKRIPGPYVQVERVPFRSLAEYEAHAASSNDFEYLVAWCDGITRGHGRGAIIRGNFTAETGAIPRSRSVAIPLETPSLLLSRPLVKTYHAALWRKEHFTPRTSVTHYQTYFYPLDQIRQWNLLYGRQGLVQYHCALPQESAVSATASLLATARRHSQSPYLVSLRRLGSSVSPGMLSFPRPGTSLALDFPMRGKQTLALLDAFDAIVADAGGRIYPAKDARLLGERFRTFYPTWEAFSRHVDPAFSSAWWERVNGRDTGNENFV